MSWLAALSAAAAVALLISPHPRLPAVATVPARSPLGDAVDPGWLRRGRLLWSGLAGAAAAVFVGGPLGLLAAVAAAAWVWRVAGRAESPASRRSRDDTRRDLPHLVGLVGDAMRGGQPTVAALSVASTALPGPAADRIARLLPRLRLGVDPALVWADLADDPDLAPLGRALGRAHESGASAGTTVERLALELARSARADVEDRARAVGVKAAVPLTLCLLPAFVLLGIVPVVAGLLAGLGL